MQIHRIKTIGLLAMVTTILAFNADTSEGQLFSRLRVGVGGPGIFDGGGVFDGGGIFDRYRGSGVIDGGGIIDGGGVFDRFDQYGQRTGSYYSSNIGYSNGCYGYAGGYNTVAGYGYQTSYPGTADSTVYYKSPGTYATGYNNGTAVISSSWRPAVQQTAPVIYQAPMTQQPVSQPCGCSGTSYQGTMSYPVQQPGSMVQPPMLKTAQGHLNTQPVVTNSKGMTDSATGLESVYTSSDSAGESERENVSAANGVSESRDGRTQASVSDVNAAEESGQSNEVDNSQQAFNQFVAAKLKLCNDAMIASAEGIKDQTANQQLQQLAATLIEDHRGVNEKLRGMLPDYVSDNSDAVSKSDESNLKRLYSVYQKTNANLMERGQEMIQRYEGEERDMAFVGSQIVGHQALIAELSAMESSVEGELKSIVSDTKAAVESHLQAAQELSKSLYTEDESQK